MITPPPHFHVRGEEKAIVTIEGDVLEGNLSLKSEKVIRLWAFKYQKELNENWQRALKQEPLIKLK